MVCIPCIVIPVLLWVFHKFIQPLIATFWPWSKTSTIKDEKGCGKADQGNSTENGVHQNGTVTKAEETLAGEGSKKEN
ncbi:UPF0729 protein C18orf32 homolog [Ostrea edulis]|uniref:UPF0729 protein C18orf32 homolog n=1 Tax=Ostrea edulis TaxID=37623 RepID=UPI0020944E3A|nr:UPF0729 protein C18orf32 homolog [Ostrea edulis]